MAVSRLSAMPAAILASVLAVAGATTITRAVRAASMCWHQPLEAVLDQAAHHLDRLVDGDAAGDADQHGAVAGRRCGGLAAHAPLSPGSGTRSCCRRSLRRRW